MLMNSAGVMICLVENSVQLLQCTRILTIISNTKLDC